AVVYDGDTGERLFDSREKGLAILLNKKENKTDYYECTVEELGAYGEYIREQNGLDSIEYYDLGTTVKDIYISGYNFVPGKLDVVYVDGEKKGEVYASYDLTPKDVSSYERIEVSEETGYDVIGPLLVGNSKDSYIFDFLERYIEDSLSDGLDNNVNEFCFQSGFLSMTSYGTTTVVLGEDINFNLFMCVDFNVALFLGGWIFIGYGLIIVLAIFFAVLTSKIKYTKLKASYDMEDYRKTMTNSMAHDLKSPLMAISGSAENLKGNLNTDKKEYYAESIIDNVDYMNSIISNILELSRLETGKLRLKKERIDIGELLDKVSKKYEEWISDKELKLGIEGELSLMGDRQLLTQAFDNLIGNACKYASEDSVISVTLDKKKITISNPSNEDVGEKASELWKPFVKGDNSRSNKKGSGIGLTIAKNIFEQHGYKMRISYEEGNFDVEVEL
ncbi:MAG: HAMP domain-containing histidine kinase, partial [Lachnospiraceae bacterium]|nr:HAMP domain-containing histidine kinase [Lachnospiraceae bacterium]